MPTAEDVYRVVYISDATRPVRQGDLDDILQGAQHHNASLGVTGLLVHAAGCFLQLLEGPRDSVESVYDRVASSSRHRALRRTLGEQVPDRAFPQWSMGFAAAPSGLFVQLLLQPLVDRRLVPPDLPPRLLVERYWALAADPA